MFDLTGKRALITGATGGIGAEIARILHAQGATITLTGSREGVLANLASDFQGGCFYQAVNLKEGNLDDLVRFAEESMGGIDILVNNAGLTRDGLAVRMKDDDFNDVLTVNLTAAFRLIRGTLKGMMKQRHGRIINVTSVVGVVGNPGQANYCASKAGLIGMSKSLAAEVASRGITVNCVAPGFIASPMTDALNDDQKQKVQTTIPMGRMGTSRDIAACVAYLASDEAVYITGQTIHVNGGMAMI
jgi:3-oxoacyl-[acyl-carrier protein] reductase